ncbi:hypothetical protein T439DRAFT_383360 [Meredithblackwellia eburnea MCA 4105]
MRLPPGLTYLPQFLSSHEQSLLLRSSLLLFQSPRHTNSHSRRLWKNYLRSLPTPVLGEGFPPENAVEFQQGHFDGVIRGYRELLIREGGWGKDDYENEELGKVMERLYALLPPSTPLPTSTSTSAKPIDPPPNLIAHLLHLSSTGFIKPHVDNKEAFGTTIVGISLGGDRVIRFQPVGEKAKEGETFDVVLEKGSVYIQQEPLRTEYTHEIPAVATVHGRQVGGTQRVSLMLRDRLPE